MNNYDVGALIASDLKRFRPSDHRLCAYCPRCGRLAAATVAYEGHLWLFRKGGWAAAPHEHVRGLSEALEMMVRKAPQDLSQAPHWEEVIANQRAALAHAMRHGAPAWQPHFALPLDVVGTLFGFPYRWDTTGCRCGAGLRLTVHSPLGGCLSTCRPTTRRDQQRARESEWAATLVRYNARRS